MTSGESLTPASGGLYWHSHASKCRPAQDAPRRRPRPCGDRRPARSTAVQGAGRLHPLRVLSCLVKCGRPCTVPPRSPRAATSSSPWSTSISRSSPPRTCWPPRSAAGPSGTRRAAATSASAGSAALIDASPSGVPTSTPPRPRRPPDRRRLLHPPRPPRVDARAADDGGASGLHPRLAVRPVSRDLPAAHRLARGRVAAVGEGLHLTRWYAREHVILCLLPALLIAGAIGAFVDKAAIIRHLGPGRAKPAAYAVGAIVGMRSRGVLVHRAAAVRGHLPHGRRARPGHRVPVRRARRSTSWPSSSPPACWVLELGLGPR
jgi:hypothetical protein